jgi:hypothetical protein
LCSSFRKGNYDDDWLAKAIIEDVCEMDIGRWTIETSIKGNRLENRNK